ncbi:MAG TPA: chemotaxis protein CheW [Anaeromyxobacteraceae bacterium]
MTEPLPQRVVVVQAGAGLCALPIRAVTETMRPAAARPLAGAPPFVAGVAIVRGVPTPVIDLAALLGGAPEEAPGRWVIVRCGARLAALAVRGVVGVTSLPGAAETQVPLLDGAASGAVAALRALDGELLVVLEESRLVPEDVLRALAGEGP